MNESTGVIIQGTKSGLVISLDDAIAMDELVSQLKSKLDKSGQFFANADVVFNLGEREIGEDELATLRDTASTAKGLQLTGIKAYSKSSLKIAEKLGLTAKELKHNNHVASKPIFSVPKRSSELTATFIRRTVRSGQVVESDGHLIVLGDANIGSEIAAAGDIIIFGALRGHAFAGANGRKQSIVAALHLAPVLLRIDEAVARCDDKKSNSQKAEFAFIENGNIVIDDWTNKNRLSIIDPDFK
ncbi:MAG: septum site-determining protein MinC [Deferribacteres bacterium]|nr:septum site-determining protein MinC [candidate division KSB1 bacterium]MCB9504341.1 septum site-determining protein MinC [Deferribacteres bacterium]